MTAEKGKAQAASRPGLAEPTPSSSAVYFAFCSDSWVILFILDLRFVFFSPSGFSVLILKIALGNRGKKKAELLTGLLVLSPQPVVSSVNVCALTCACSWVCARMCVCSVDVCALMHMCVLKHSHSGEGMCRLSVHQGLVSSSLTWGRTRVNFLSSETTNISPTSWKKW